MNRSQFRRAVGWCRRHKWLLAVIAAFLLSRLGSYLAGVRFDMTPLEEFWQYLDVNLLRSRLLESLWYLHSQPPLYNLYLGLVLKLTPNLAPLFAAT